jgi:prepilin-type N-terminal cleavage/methylation domain-containing protein
MTRPRPATHGFTLIELLVVSAIAMVIFLVGFQMINGTVALSARGTARIRATENARVFFQMFERDIASACPGLHGMVKTRTTALSPASPYPSANVPMGVLERDADNKDHDILQFYTKTDSPKAPDEYLFARYYVCRHPDTLENTLCRQTVSYIPTDPVAPELQDPRELTDISSGPEADAAVTEFGLFDHADEMFVDYMLWDPVNKTTTKSTTPEDGNWTHIKVTIRINGKEGENTVLQSFSKVFEIPAGFK